MNNSKTKVVVFSRGRMKYGWHLDFVFREENIETISEYQYQGILFKYNGIFRNGKLELKKMGLLERCSHLMGNALNMTYHSIYNVNYLIQC